MSKVIIPKLPYFLCAVTIGAIVGGRICYQFGPYMAGRWGIGPINYPFELGGMAAFGVCFGVGFLSAIVLVGIFSYRIILVGAPKKKTLVEALVIGALIASTFCLCFWTVQPANQYFLAGFKTCLVKHANIQKIQHWTRTLQSRDGLIPETDWPPFVSDLAPSFVSVETVKGNREVSLTWGGGFFHWGLALGDTPVGDSAHSEKRVQVMDDFSYVWVDSQ